jgi:hypothetical protein
MPRSDSKAAVQSGRSVVSASGLRRVGDALRTDQASVVASVLSSVRDAVSGSIRASVYDAVLSSVWDEVAAAVWDSVSASVKAAIRDATLHQERDLFV